MCYSEELKREAGGHLVGAQWVLAGWKTIQKKIVKQIYLEPKMPSRALPKWVCDDKLKPVDAYSHYEEVTHQETIYVSWYQNSYVYKFGEVLRDEHGFHVAATHEGAMNAYHQGASWGEGLSVVFCRTLVLESAIRDNHAHVMMILKPGEMETQEQINAVAAAAWTEPKPDKVAIAMRQRQYAVI